MTTENPQTKKQRFFKNVRPLGLTFDDVLILPGYSQILPHQVETTTYFSRNILLSIPFIGAAMDTVTESGFSIAIAQCGGIGVIHKNMSIEQQAAEVRKVKRKDIQKTKDHPFAGKDAKGRLRVAAAVGVTVDIEDRVSALVLSGVDAIVIDTAHGHSKGVIDAIKNIKEKFGTQIDIVAGNVVTASATQALIKAGVDAVKVGIGPGSICTTRVIAGIGVPQFTAIMDCSKAAFGTGVPIIADGGIKQTGDVAKAIAAGASSVMMGSVFAGTDESPGKPIIYKGKKFKTYRGMGSIESMSKGSKDRYFQENETDEEKLVPEGVSGMVPAKGPLKNVIYQYVGGLRAAMGYTGSPDIKSLQMYPDFIQITAAGVKENHPHNVVITKESPNYSKN